MNIVIRHIISWLVFSLVISSSVLGFTLLIFPLDDWMDLFQQTIFEIPFLAFVYITPLSLSLIVGTTIGWHYRQRFKWINRLLGNLNKGETITFEREQFKDLSYIQESLEELQEKLTKQTELSQKLATERAEDREKNLQDVIIQERNRLARELHDSVSQQLFAASMMMSAISERSDELDPALKKQLLMVEEMIQQSQLEMRALLLHLRPVALKGKSLQEGAEELLLELRQKTTLEIDWQIESFKVAKGIEDHLFRILQESISNTLRHANASTLHVMIIERDQHIIMRVVDDGIGFDLEEVRPSAYGLQNMQERALEVGGTLKLVSLPNQGARLEIKVPQITSEVEEND